jgi:acyl-CoA synthetase (AMP-forming)/AMP-acid ligase II
MPPLLSKQPLSLPPLRNVLTTTPGLTFHGTQALQRIEVLLSAGAPVPVALLEHLQPLVPNASLHTPYGMTEALPVTDIQLEQIREALAASVTGAGNGVCVGRAVPGAEVRISALDSAGVPSGDPTGAPGVTGEILVRAPHVKDRYYRLWVTERESSRTAGWHRTGDVGHLDAEERLWVEGRLAHIITSPNGVVTPVGPEQTIEQLEEIRQAAVVGVGPSGTQAVVAVVVAADGTSAAGLAPSSLSESIRKALRQSGIQLAAVLTIPSLPTDIRHNAKIDRAAVASWAEEVLEGRRRKKP